MTGLKFEADQMYPHHHELGEEAGVRQCFDLNLWATNGIARKEVKVASVDLRALASVLTELSSLLVGATDAI